MPFCCFEAFLREIHCELLFLVKKGTISETCTEKLRIFFLPCLKGEIPEDNLDLFKQQFLITQVKENNF